MPLRLLLPQRVGGLRRLSKWVILPQRVSWGYLLPRRVLLHGDSVRVQQLSFGAVSSQRWPEQLFHMPHGEFFQLAEV